MLTYGQARAEIFLQLTLHPREISTTQRSVWDALGYVLAENILADRNYPAFDRSTRDGYAVRAAEVIPGKALQCVGEIKAGDALWPDLRSGTCAHIMTGGPLPRGADAVVMIEHTSRTNSSEAAADPATAQIHFTRAAHPGDHVVASGSEGRAGQLILKSATRLGFAELAAAAQVGAATLKCARLPRIAILSTGDEIVPVEQTPGPSQIRNSNSVSLAAQVRLAGGEPVILGAAADESKILRAKILEGLAEDALVISGGVSMGRYDLVEPVLKDLGAQFFFDAVAIRPGKPAVFAICQGKPVFGLPGNPISSMVTFQLFVAPAIDILSGASPRSLPLVEAILAEPLQEKIGMTHFLPARVEWTTGQARVSALRWQSSGDIVAMATANCFVVVPADRERIPAGDRVNILLRKEII